MLQTVDSPAACVNQMRFVFYCRYPLIASMILSCYGMLAWFTNAHTLLANTLLLHDLWQTVSLTLMCLIAARLFIVQVKVISVNGPSRFTELVPFARLTTTRDDSFFLLRWEWSLTETVWWLISGLSLPIACVLTSAASGLTLLESRSSNNEFPNTVDLFTGMCGIATAISLDLICVVTVAVANSQWFGLSSTSPTVFPVRSTSIKNYADNWTLDRVLLMICDGPGYSKPSSNCRKQTLPAHREHFLFLLLLACSYIALTMLVKSPAASIVLPGFTILFYGVVCLMFLSTVFAMSSFYLDYYRIPVMLCIPLVLFASYALTGFDHNFESERSATVAAAPELLKVVHHRTIPPDNHDRCTLIVVTAPGGGIHAATWTAQVLTGLHERYGQRYADSVSLISAVSGGSVGTMMYAANLPSLDGDPRCQDFRKACHVIVERAAASSLESIGFGMLFHDLPSLFPPFSSSVDRGSTLERCWQERIFLDGNSGGSLFMSDWSTPTEKGQMPIIVFNATEVETGRRVIFSPIQTIRPPYMKANQVDEVAPVEFSRSYAPYKLRVATAVRLSSTFPYFSPSATLKEEESFGHIVDGGYADNEGIETAIDWLNSIVRFYALPNAAECPFHRILLLRIRHQVPRDPLDVHDSPQIKSSSSGFVNSTLGPLKTMLTVRVASQVERGALEVNLLSQSARRIERDKSPIEVESLFLDFVPGRVESQEGHDHGDPPLSWKLSPRQFAVYRRAWDALCCGEAIKILDKKYFTPITNTAP